MVPLEAMSHGVPVIASNVSSLPEVVIPNQTGLLFTVGDSAELADLLLKTSATEWKTMGANARELHNSKFTVESMVADVMKVYGSK